MSITKEALIPELDTLNTIREKLVAKAHEEIEIRFKLEAENKELLEIAKLANTVVNHIGAFGEIDSRHESVFDLLQALQEYDPNVDKL